MEGTPARFENRQPHPSDESVLLAVFAKIDRARHAQRERQNHRPRDEQHRADDRRKNAAGAIDIVLRGDVLDAVVGLEFPERAVAQLHLRSLPIEHVKRLRALREKRDVHEWRRALKNGRATFDPDVQEHHERASDDEVSRPAKQQKHRALERAPFAFLPCKWIGGGVHHRKLADRDFVTLHHLLRDEVNKQRQ